MKVAILHLSDIHIEKADDWICTKGEKIAQSVLGTWEKLNTIFVVVSGDIANKGLSEQYFIAHSFFTSIKEYIHNQSDAEVYFIIAPGNHDCDFSNGDFKARNAFIDTVIRNPSIIEKGDSIYKGCLSVQENFFSFISSLDSKVKYPSNPEIFYQIELDLNNQRFYFNIFNTAWLSQIEEKQGGLVFPNHLINLETEKLSSCAFSASVFHHPENWLDSSNAIEFRRLTEKYSDIILSGHEHSREVFFKRQAESEIETQIIKADALQERNDPESSSFNLIIVDLDSKKQKLFRFKWKGSEYTKIGKENDWQDFVRNRFLQSQSFYLESDFENYIDTLDSVSWHSRKRNVKLEDFFVAPRLFETSLKNVIDGKSASKRIESDKFFDFLYEKRKLIIFGETWQGKTTVAKRVFRDFYEKQYATLLIDGSQFEKATEENFKRVLRSAFSKHYNEDLWERFLQLPKDKRAVVIDNFGQSNLNQKSLQELLRFAGEYFDLVIVFAHSDLSLQQYLQNENKEVKFSDYIHCKMLPLNQTQRTQLIRRWTRFESDSSIEEKELIRQENQLRTVIQNAVNSGLIVSTPFYILGVLQLIESYKNDPNSQFGSIGYIYEGVITNRLSGLKKTPPQINQMFLVISLIAYWLYKNDVTEINEDDLQQVIKEYNQSYRENIYLPNFLSDLETAQILIKQTNGNWKFAGSHQRDFFIAKYYAQALGEEDSREKEQAQLDVKSMIETIIYEPHTRILLFLVYEANSNKSLIRWILNEAKRVYATFEVANFETDVKFINELEQSVLDENLLESDDPRKNQDKQDALISYSEDEENTSLDDNYNKRLVKYSDDLDEFTKAAISLKMVELVGQLVKSFAGTIKAELKHELIEECINIGLRFLHSVFEFHQNNIEELSKILKHLIRQQHPQLSEPELESRKDELLTIVHNGLAYGIIKKISLSVGSEDLKASFTDVFESVDKLTSYKLVETAIKLDHYNSPFADKLIKLGRQIRENKFAYNVLKRLIADYVNYFEITGSERQKLVDEFKLNGSSNYLLNYTKDERSTHLMPKKFTPPEK